MGVMLLLQACKAHEGGEFQVPSSDVDLPVGKAYVWVPKLDEGPSVVGASVATDSSTEHKSLTSQESSIFGSLGREPIGNISRHLLSGKLGREILDGIDAEIDIQGLDGIPRIYVEDPASFAGKVNVLVELNGCNSTRENGGVIARLCATPTGMEFWVVGGANELETHRDIEGAVPDGRYFTIGEPRIINGDRVFLTY